MMQYLFFLFFFVLFCFFAAGTSLARSKSPSPLTAGYRASCKLPGTYLQNRECSTPAESIESRPSETIRNTY